MAVRVIYECRTEIDQETENDDVFGHLKTAAVALDAFVLSAYIGFGGVWP